MAALLAAPQAVELVVLEVVQADLLGFTQVLVMVRHASVQNIEL